MFGPNIDYGFLVYYQQLIKKKYLNQVIHTPRFNKNFYITTKILNDDRYMLMFICNTIIRRLWLGYDTKEKYREEMDNFIFKRYNFIIAIKEFYYRCFYEN